jgi:hypothetical protein
VATASSNGDGTKSWRGQLRWYHALFAALALALIYFLAQFERIKGEATLGTAYEAHVICSCRYIAGRELGLCKADMEEGTAIVRIADDPEHKRVSASVPLIASAVAERRGASGCIILNEQERKKL